MTEIKQYPFAFKGAGGEFFKIWIVNVLLTIATLGIYSAWAKVRTNRYFYGNTILNDASFEYLASPIAILKGRLIAVGLFIVYSVLSGLSPLFGSILLLLFFLATPYIVIRSLRFNHRMSAYKNIRFDFEGSFGEAAMVNLVWPILSIISLGLLYPLAHQRFVRFYVSNTKYGKSAFESSAMAGQFYSLYIMMFVAGIVISAVTAGIAYSLGAIPSGFNPQDPAQMKAQMLPFIVAMYGFSLLIYLMMFAVFKSLMVNLIMNTMTVDDHFHFESKMSLWQMSWILLTNLLAIAFSFGLAYPWAKVRLARYRAENTELLTRKSLDEFFGTHVDPSSAIGEEMVEVFDLGAGL